MKESRKIFAVLYFVLCSMVATVAYGPAVRAQIDSSGQSLPFLFNADSLKADARRALALVGPDEATILAGNALLRQPIDQGALALLLMGLERKAGMERELRRGMDLLPRLGWRDSDAMNLLYRNALDRTPPDYPASMRYADALLRRDRNSEDVFPMLTALEQNAAARPAVVAMLAGKPKWRLQYLAATARIRPEEIGGRMETVRALKTAGSTLDDREFAALVNGLDRRGEVDAAYGLWRAARLAGDPAALPFDGDFRRAAAAGHRPAWLSAPFEWNFGSDPSFSVRFDKRESAAMTVDWDGRGAPLFAWQRVRLAGGRQRLTVALDDPRGRMTAIDFRLNCPGHEQVRFEMRPADSNTLTSDATDVSPLSCRFPLLEIRGLPSDLPSPIRFSPRSIKLTSIAA